MHLRLLVLLALVLSLAGCGGVGSSSPAERLVGRWEGTFGNAIEFYPNQVYIQTNPSGNRFAGTYTLSEDGTSISSESNGTAVTSPVELDGDTLTIFGSELKRTADVEEVLTPSTEALVGTWSGQGGTYSFYPEGTWTISVGNPEPSGGGTFALSPDGKTITRESILNGKQETPFLLVTKSLLVISSPFVFDRVADAPEAPFPSGFLNSEGKAAPEQISGVVAGEVRDVGPFSLVLHQSRRLTFTGGTFGAIEGEYLGVEFSLRNNGDELVGGPNTWRYAILSASGERLNEESVVSYGFASEDADQVPAECAASLQATALLPVTTGSLVPGAALRTWVLFKLTPGLDAPDLQLEVLVGKGAPGLSFSQPETLGTVTFLLNGATSDDPLPWTPKGGVVADSVTINGITFSGVTAGEPVEAREGDPCSAERPITVQASNGGASTAAALAPGGVLLLDTSGRIYNVTGSMTTRSINGEYTLGPREAKEVVYPFPASFGVRDSIAALVLLDGETWYQIPVK